MRAIMLRLCIDDDVGWTDSRMGWMLDVLLFSLRNQSVSLLLNNVAPTVAVAVAAEMSV